MEVFVEDPQLLKVLKSSISSSFLVAPMHWNTCNSVYLHAGLNTNVIKTKQKKVGHQKLPEETSQKMLKIQIRRGLQIQQRVCLYSRRVQARWGAKWTKRNNR